MRGCHPSARREPPGNEGRGTGAESVYRQRGYAGPGKNFIDAKVRRYLNISAVRDTHHGDCEATGPNKHECPGSAQCRDDRYEDIEMNLDAQRPEMLRDRYHLIESVVENEAQVGKQ